MYGKSYRLGNMYILSIILLFVIQISYGHSYAVYSTTMISLVAVTLFHFLKNIKKYPQVLMLICVSNLIVSFFIGFVNGGFQDALMAGASLLLPLAFASYHIVTDRIGNICRIIGVGLIILHFMQPYIPVLANMNVNSYSFLMFIGFSSIFILIQYKKSPVHLLLLFGVLYVMSNSGSRNAFSIAIVICGLTLLPYKVLTNAIVYRGMYLISLFYQAFSEAWLEFTSHNSRLTNLFNNLIEPFFNKSWGIENRVDVLVNVSEILWRQNIWRLLFGNGIAFKHAHNGFYQSVYMYGLVGTILIFVFYVIMFEMAFRVMVQSKKPLVMGCVLSLCGLLLIQGADVFMWGTKSCVVVPFLLMGVIIRTYMEQRWNESLVLPKGEADVSK